MSVVIFGRIEHFYVRCKLHQVSYKRNEKDHCTFFTFTFTAHKSNASKTKEQNSPLHLAL
jgi:hypothetical protein